MPEPQPDPDPILNSKEVAAMFRVDQKTVTRWANEGRIPSFRTPGNHLRYWESQILPLLAVRPENRQPGTGAPDE